MLELELECKQVKPQYSNIYHINDIFESFEFHRLILKMIIDVHVWLGKKGVA